MPTNGFDTKLVKDLAKILCDSELSEIEIDYNGTKIKVARTNNVVAQVQSYSAPPVAAAPAPAAAPIEAPAAPKAPEANKNYLTSPMVGTVYLSPEPGVKQFVQVGDKIKEGQQLFIIEAMKTMNAVNSTASGTVKEILVKDGQPVEFGENLCVIE